MTIALLLGHALLIGIVAGMRTMIAGTAVTYQRGSPWWILFAVLALVELVGDKLPKTPARTIPPVLLFRCVTGGAAAYFLVHTEAGALLAIVCGVAGALIGTYGGYAARRALTHGAHLPDLPVALGEDIIAISLAALAVAR